MEMLQTVVETKAFAADAKRLLSDAERTALIEWLAANPTAGDLMEGTGGARKVRWAATAAAKAGASGRSRIMRVKLCHFSFSPFSARERRQTCRRQSGTN